MSNEQLRWLLKVIQPARTLASLPGGAGLSQETHAALLGLSPEGYTTELGRMKAEAKEAASELLADPAVASMVDRLPLRRGATVVAFDDGPRSTTDFRAAFLLAAFGDGPWQPAVRVDWFAATVDPTTPNPRAERGNAVTVALNWRPRPWLRLTGEALWVHSVRGQRRDEGNDAGQDETQLQVMARFLF